MIAFYNRHLQQECVGPVTYIGFRFSYHFSFLFSLPIQLHNELHFPERVFLTKETQAYSKCNFLLRKFYFERGKLVLKFALSLYPKASNSPLFNFPKIYRQGCHFVLKINLLWKIWFLFNFLSKCPKIFFV